MRHLTEQAAGASTTLGALRPPCPSLARTWQAARCKALFVNRVLRAICQLRCRARHLATRTVPVWAVHLRKHITNTVSSPLCYLYASLALMELLRQMALPEEYRGEAGDSLLIKD